MKPRLTITTAKESREKHLDALARFLGPQETLVVTVDTYTDDGRMVLQVPLDPGAEVVAREPPRIQPGGVTELVSYVRCTGVATTMEITVENSEISHRREITPAVKREGPTTPPHIRECP